MALLRSVSKAMQSVGTTLGGYDYLRRPAVLGGDGIRDHGEFLDRVHGRLRARGAVPAAIRHDCAVQNPLGGIVEYTIQAIALEARQVSQHRIEAAAVDG